MLDISALDAQTLLHIAQIFPQVYERACLAEQASSSLLAYSRFQWDDFLCPPHIKLLIEKLEAVERGDIKRLAISMPPRHGKSFLTSQTFPAWYLGRHPNHYIIHATYSKDLALDFGRKVRDQMQEPAYQQVFPNVRLKSTSTAAERFETVQGGIYYAVGSGGPVTGRGAHIFLADDLVKDAEAADSELQRKSLAEWYNKVALTRLERDLKANERGAIVLIGTRWHEDDIIGYVLREHAHQGWEVVNIPALCIDPDTDPLHRAMGDALWPEKFPVPELESIRQSIGPRDWSALYQQAPSADDGDIFKRVYWMEWDSAKYGSPEVEYIVQSYDTAYSEKKTADYTAIQTWGVFRDKGGTPCALLLGQVCERVEYPKLRAMAQEQYREWQPDVCIVEAAASGHALIPDLRRAGIPVVAVKTDRDKTTRAHACLPLFESRRVYVPKGKFYAGELMNQCAKFPYGRHDDLVDAMLLALERLKNGYFLTAKSDPEPEEYSRSDRKGYW
jgi:predicted phage terminase large subunit-like protein